MKNFLRRKSSRLVSGDEKSNKNNSKPTLAPIADNEPEPSKPSASDLALDRRASVAETVSSTSTQESKKKETYLARLAAESRDSPQLSPWLAMTNASHSAIKAVPKPTPRPKPRTDSMSARLSVDGPPAGAGGSSSTPSDADHRSNGQPGSSDFEPPSLSIAVPSSPMGTLFGTPTSPMPSPPMPSYPPPAPPGSGPPSGGPIGALANPFREEETREANPHAVRPPPPPPPPAKIHRTPPPPPPSAFSMHKKPVSGRTSPGPGLRQTNLPSPPIPPPPPPALSPSTDKTPSNADASPEAQQPSPASPTWESWLPDLTGYYGGNSPFIAELESPETTPKLPSDDPKQQEAELPTADHEDQLQAKEDLREAAKVLLPVSPDTADASSETPKEAAAPEPPDGVLLSHSVHASLMSELADLRKRVSDVQKLHKASQTRVREWEAYRVSMDKYIQQLSKDRQVLVERLTTSEQAAAERQQQSANMFKQLNSTNADWQAHAQRLENQVKQLERDKADALMQVVQQSDRANAAEDDKKRSLVASQEEARRAQVAMTADFDGRAKAYEMMTTQMSTHIEHLEKHEKHRIAQVSDLEAERQRLQNENTGLKATVEDWKLQHGAVSSARSAATKELQLSRARVVNLEAEANKTKLQLEEGERVKAELADTQQKLERMKDTEKTLEQFVSTATEEKDKLRELLKASTAARGRLGAALTEAEGKVADGEKKIKMLEKANEAQKKRMYMLGQRMAEKVDWWEGQLRPQRATA